MAIVDVDVEPGVDVETREEARLRFVEDFGLLFEEAGAPRMAGRMLAYLLICDPPYQTAGQLTTALSASKASISTMGRYLTQLGLAERYSRPGDRRDYLRVGQGSWSMLLRVRLTQAQAMRRLAERGLTLTRRTRPLPSEPLEDLRDLYVAIEAHWQEITHDYERLVAARHGLVAVGG